MEPLEGTYGVQNTFTKFVEYCREAIFATRSPYFITYAKREKEAKEAAENAGGSVGLSAGDDLPDGRLYSVWQRSRSGCCCISERQSRIKAVLF